MPKILLSAKLNKQFYTDAVNASGGTAVTEYLPKFSKEYSGLILCGGSDINPKLYCEEINGAVDIDYLRDENEIKLIKSFLEYGKPIMGICRGCQLLNVYFGGSLYQDIENSNIHKSLDGIDLIHKITAEKGSISEGLYGGEFTVNSAHHQAIKELGQNLRITQYAGTTAEGFEHNTLNVFGFQWHPERMCLSKKRDDTVDGIRIFKYFVDLCR